MAQKINLRTETSKLPQGMPKATVVDFPGLKGTLPFTPEKVIGNHDNLPDEVAAFEQEVASAPIVTPEEQKKKVVDPTKTNVVKFESLSEAKQQELLSSISAAMEQSQAPKFIPRNPSIGEAMATARRAAEITDQALKASAKEIKQTVKTNLKAITPVTPPVPPPVMQQPEPPPVAPTPEPTPAPVPQADAGGVAAGTICIHCGWPVGTREGCEPDRMDKQMFVAAVLGQQRFYKTYDLLGGQLSVCFRTLTIKENDLVIKQLIQDWNDGKISGPAHSVTEAARYQLALGLDSIATNVGPIKMAPLEDYEYDEPEKGTILPDIATYVQTTAIKTEHLRRIISKAHAHFVETVSKLEAMAETPDFWKATAG